MSVLGSTVGVGTRPSGWLHAYVPTPVSDDDLLAMLRSRIGETAFEVAQAQGAAMGRTRAVEYATAQEAANRPPSPG